MNMQVPTFANPRRAGLIAVLLVLIAPQFGCGGSGDSSVTSALPQTLSAPTSSAPTNFPALPTSNPDTGGGHWWGGLSRGDEVVSRAMCLLLETGELACVLRDLSENAVGLSSFNEQVVGAVHGTVQVSRRTQASGAGKIYATPGNVLTDGSSVVADFIVTDGKLYDGDMGRNSLLELKFTSLGEEFTFNGYFDHYYAVYGQHTLIWRADGVYTTFDIYGDPASLSIDPDGGLFMQSASGCSGIGNMTRVGPPYGPNVKAYNAHHVELTVSDCAGLDGAYKGLATLIDFAWVNGTDDLVIAVFNDTATLVGLAVK